MVEARFKVSGSVAESKSPIHLRVVLLIVSLAVEHESCDLGAAIIVRAYPLNRNGIGVVSHFDWSMHTYGSDAGRDLDCVALGAFSTYFVVAGNRE